MLAPPKACKMWLWHHQAINSHLTIGFATFRTTENLKPVLYQGCLPNKNKYLELVQSRGRGSWQAADPDFLHENFSSRFQGGGGGLKGDGSWVPDFLKQIKFHISKKFSFFLLIWKAEGTSRFIDQIQKFVMLFHKNPEGEGPYGRYLEL